MAIAPDGERVTCTIDGGVADVRLNRPDKLNALDVAMFDALIATGEALDRDRSVRAVVLSGEGRGFCAGLDLASLLAMSQLSVAAEVGGDAEAAAGTRVRRTDTGSDLVSVLGRRGAGRITNRAQHAAYVWHEMGVPTIAAIHGAAVGGGLQLALGADLRFVAADAHLAVLEVRWGLVPDMTGTYFLPRLVGSDVAKDLVWSGRSVNGNEAVRIGLATSVHDDPRAAALAFGTEIAARSPDAVRRSKTLIDQSLEVDAAEQFLAESRTMARLVGSPDQVEAAIASIEKRPATFAGPAPTEVVGGPSTTPTPTGDENR